MAMGDAIEQWIESSAGTRTSQWDQARTMRLGITGLVTTGPLAHMLFTKLEDFHPGTSMKAVLHKVGLNAAFMPCMITTTLSTAWLLQGETIDGICDSLHRELPEALSVGLCFWPLANIVVYKAINVPWRPIVSSAFGGLWGIYLSACANNVLCHSELA